MFMPLQEESSNRVYALTLARFVCMVLRSLEDDMHYKPLTAEQRTLAVELREALNSTSSNSNSNSGSLSSPAAAAIVQRPFHALCVALFCRMNYEDGRSSRGMEECPVYRFLMFASLRGSSRGGGFEPASVVRQICAQLKFSIRLVVYHEIFQQVLRDDQQWACSFASAQDRGSAAAMTVDDAPCPWEARIKQREQLQRFVHADECTPFAAIHNISLVAKSIAGRNGPSGMSSIPFYQ
jgi:hypothetical protein